jgi:hypothetical protein
MDRFTRLFAALERIFGKGFVSRIFGKQSNVITLPSKDAQRFLTTELNISEASEGAINIGKQDLEKIVSDTKRLSQLNDQELLVITNNAERLAQRVNPNVGPDAEVINLGTKEKVSPEGIMQLKEQAGQVSPPGTMMGNIESKINKLKASVKEMDTGANMDTIMADALKSQQGFKKLQDQGLVTAATREILQRDIKAGKIKLPKEVEDRIMLVEGNPGRVDPIQIFREQYGEDALEQVDSLVPDLAKARSYKDLLNIVDNKYTIKPRSSTIPQTINIDDAKKAEKEFNIIPADSEEGKMITEKLIGKPKASVTELVTAEKIILDMKKMDPMDAMKEANKVLKKEGKYKNLQEKDVKRIMDDTNDFIFGRDIPEDPEGFAVGGRVGMASGGIAALKTLIRFLGKDSGKKGSKMLKEINPKQFGYKFDMLDPEMKNAINKNRLEYLENLSDVIKADKKLLREMKELPKEWQDLMYKQANEGGNKGRLDIYNKINIDDAIGDIEQMKKNLEFKDIPGKEIQRKMNAEGGSQGLDYLMGIERRGYSEGTTGLNATPQQNAMISDMHKRGMDVDTISTVVGVSTQEVQDAINSQAPAQVNQLNPIGTLSKIGSFFSNPVVQGIGAIATGGLTSLGTYAKGQLFGNIAGNLIGNQFNQQMYEQNLSDRGLSGGYTGTAAQQDALASEMSQNYGGSNESTGGDNSNASESGGSDTEGSFAVGGRVGYAGGGRKKIYDLGKQLLNNKKEKTFGGLQINMSDAMDDARLMKEMGLQGGKPGDYDKFLEMKLSGELGPQKQMQTIKMELFNRYSNFLDDATMDLVQSSNNPQKVAEVYANVKEASILRDRGLGTEEIVDTIVNTPRTKQADGTRPQGLNYLMGY